MIQFQGGVEKHGSTRLESLDNFKDIKSMESSSPEKIRDFWDSLFEKRDTYVPDENENLFAEVLVGQVMSFILISIWGRSSVMDLKISMMSSGAD